AALNVYGMMPTNLVVLRVGDGNQTLTNIGNSMFLDQFTTDGASVSTIAIADNGPTAMIEPGNDGTGSGITGSTAVTRSMDKRFLVFGGYHTSLGNATVLNGSSTASIPRYVVALDAMSQY